MRFAANLENLVLLGRDCAGEVVRFSLYAAWYPADGAFLKNTQRRTTYSTIRQASRPLAFSRVNVTCRYDVMTNICSSARHIPQSTDKKPQHLFQNYMKPDRSVSQYILLLIMKQYIPQQTCPLESVHILRPITLCTCTQLGSNSPLILLRWVSPPPFSLSLLPCVPGTYFFQIKEQGHAKSQISDIKEIFTSWIK